MKDLLRISDLGEADLVALLRTAMTARDDPHGQHLTLRDETVVLYFDRAATRERLAFASAVTRLGGSTVDIRPDGAEGTPEELGRLLGDVASAVVVHVGDDALLARLAHATPAPVVNAGSAVHSPVTALAALLVLEDAFGSLGRVELAYVGPGFAAANSLIEAAALGGVDITVATPARLEPDARVVERARRLARRHGGLVDVGHDPHRATAGALALCAASWTSPFRAASAADADAAALAPYAIDPTLVSLADPNGVFLPIPPVRAGVEVDQAVLDAAGWTGGALDATRTFVAQAVLWSLLERRVEGRVRDRRAGGQRRLFAVNGA